VTVLALVESNTTGSGREFCAAARARGLRPVLLTRDPDRYPYVAEDGVDTLDVDTSDDDAVLIACRGIGAGLVGVISSSEYFLVAAATAAAKLGLGGADPAALLRCRHKDRQRHALAAAGLPVPAFRTATEIDAAVAAAGDLSYPVVVKPTTGSGSVGVRLCRTAAEVAAHADGLLCRTANERGIAGPRLVLVEEYVTGPEFSVETLGATPVAVVGKRIGPEPYFVETGHDVPAPVERRRSGELATVAMRAVAALGVGWGAAHTELRWTARGPVLVEVNPRLAGGMIPALVRLATGVDLVDAVVARAAGHATTPVPGTLGAASIRFVRAGRSGTVTAIDGTDDAHAMPGVACAVVTVRPADTVTLSQSFTDRIGYAIASGPDPATSARRATAAAAALRIDIRPIPLGSEP
jgi:biotin carboxylase